MEASSLEYQKLPLNYFNLKVIAKGNYSKYFKNLCSFLRNIIKCQDE